MTENSNRRTDYSYFRPADIILILLIAAIIVATLSSSDSSSDSPAVIRVSTPDSSFIMPLNTDTTAILHGRIGTLELKVEDSGVKILRAPCRGQDCVKSGWIRNRNESLICLPSGVSVWIESSAAGESPDAFTY